MLQQLIQSIGLGPLIGVAVLALVIILFVIGYILFCKADALNKAHT